MPMKEWRGLEPESLSDAYERVEGTGTRIPSPPRTTLPKGLARANQALVEGLNNEDRSFAISEKSRMFKGDCVLRRSLGQYGGAPPGDHIWR
ncbi:hypothetical protein MRB53_035493 [Persea americana]|uniref:Uncharacterized protein n=1 Tax=Persea americana TaxID=3435 RepID=A0ACC2K4T0_PERAE|nr:hypothetical protein MRB53_035493 [Persea americana]